MNIKDLIKQDTSNLTSRVEFKAGIILHLRYVSRSQVNLMSRECEVLRYNEKLKARVPELNGKKFVELFCKAAVVNWEGVTPRSLSSVIAMNDVPADQLDVPIPFSIDNLVALTQEAVGLDNFIQETALDVRNFQRSQEEEIKNS